MTAQQYEAQRAYLEALFKRAQRRGDMAAQYELLDALKRLHKRAQEEL